jgi:hypothetical protein
MRRSRRRRTPCDLWCVRFLVSLLAFGTGGCLATTSPASEGPRFESWDVGDRVGLARSKPVPDARPTRVVVVPQGATLAETDGRRTLCSGESPCELALPPGRRRAALYDEASSTQPAAEFWLDVDERPMLLEVERPKVGLAYAGAVLTVVGLVGIVFGGIGKESGGSEAASNALFFGGAGLAATGLTLGVIYWVDGQGEVRATPLAR